MAGTPRVPDPQGRIARARARMPSNCSVRKSPFCDEIIALRLQGFGFKKIAAWLADKGQEFGIPATTLYRNLNTAFAGESIGLPEYERVAEGMGGDIPLDAQRTLAGQALLQRRRIDEMIRVEEERRRTRPGAFNPRIRQEMETYLALVQAASDHAASQVDNSLETASAVSVLTEEAEEAIANLILSGDVTLPGTAHSPHKVSLKLVGS